MNLYMEEGDFLGANNEHVPGSEIDPSFKKADPVRHTTLRFLHYFIPDCF